MSSAMIEVDRRPGEELPPQPLRTEPLAALDRRFRDLRLPLSAARRKQLAVSLQRYGQRLPLLVSDGIEAGRLVLLDGFKRADLLQDQGCEQALLRVCGLDGPSSLATMLAANAGQRGPSALEEAWIVETLQREHGLSQQAIAALLQRHRSWVCRRLSLLTRLVERVQADVRIGLVSPTAARELARLPRGNQVQVAEVVASHSLTSRQTARLVPVLLHAPASEWDNILRDPLGHLREPGNGLAIRPDPRLGRVGNRLRQELLRLHGAANRLGELFLAHPPTSLPQQDAVILADLAGPIVVRVDRPLEFLNELLALVQEAPDGT